MRPHTILCAILLAACAVSASATEPSKEASIPFANLGGIRDWQADGDRALYVQGRNNKWYHAELMGSCMDLPFAEHIGFVIEPTGDFDRFSAILVHGHPCMLKSFTESGAPPTKRRGKTAAGAAQEQKPAKTPTP